MASSAAYPPFRPARYAQTADVNDTPDPDESPSALAQTVDETLDACCSAWDEGNMGTARALLTAAQVSVDALLQALGTSDPDEAY